MKVLSAVDFERIIERKLILAGEAGLGLGHYALTSGRSSREAADLADIFVSYARSTATQAQQITEALRGAGYSVWRDDELPAHRAYAEVIEERLKQAKAVIVIWSAEAVKSEWVRSEADRARNDRKLVQLTLDATALPMPFDQTQCADLSGWNGDLNASGWRKIVASIADLMGGAAPAHAPSVRSERAGLAICVLPFANMSADPEQEYFADGISEDIITDLSKVSALWVAARNTAFTFKGKHVDVPQVARQLKCSHVLEGSVRKSGNRVRITAQLIDGATGGHVWAERYDRSLDDIFALQDEISEAIVTALKIKLLPEEKQAIEDRGTTNVEAYDIYLRARALTHQLGGASSKRAVELLREALALDPNFLPAAFSLHEALYRYAIFAPGHRAEARREIEATVERVIDLRPDHWSALALQACLLIDRYDFLGAEPLIEKARRHFHGAALPDDLMWLSQWFAGVVGRHGEAIEILQEVIRRDPLSFEASYTLQTHLHVMGRADEEEAEYARSRDLTGEKSMVELLALHRMWNRAERQEILAQYRRFVAARLSGFDLPASAYAQLEVVLFEPEAARELLLRAFDDPHFQNPVSTFYLAIFACLYGNWDLALAAWRRAFVDMSFLPFWVMWYPEGAEARKDPRFKEIVSDLGLYDYWRASGKWGDFARPVGDDDFEIIR